MKALFLLTVALALVSCDESPTSTTRTFQTENPAYEVDFLFERDGVKVYRFYDKSYWRYFTTKGDTFSTEHHRRGKNSSVNIPNETTSLEQPL